MLGLLSCGGVLVMFISCALSFFWHLSSKFSSEPFCFISTSVKLHLFFICHILFCFFHPGSVICFTSNSAFSHVQLYFFPPDPAKLVPGYGYAFFTQVQFYFTLSLKSAFPKSNSAFIGLCLHSLFDNSVLCSLVLCQVSIFLCKIQLCSIRPISSSELGLKIVLVRKQSF